MRIRNPAILTVLFVIAEIQTFAQLQDLRHVHNYLHQTQGGEYKRGIFRDFFTFMYVIQHCFISRPADSIVTGGCWNRTQNSCNFGTDSQTEDAGIEPRTLATLALTVKRSNHLARSHPPLARSHPQAEKKALNKKGIGVKRSYVAMTAKKILGSKNVIMSS